jgi:hypothetical protein
MTSGLELIVRPFLPRDVRPVPVPVANAKATGPVSLTFGTKGGAIVFKYSKFESVSFSSTPSYVETKRETVTKRIKNPQDDQQYVDVEVIKKVSFKDKNADNQQPIPFEYHPTGV